MPKGYPSSAALDVIRKFLLVLSIAGGSLFGLMFAASALNPGYVEKVAKELIRLQIEKKIHEKVESLDAKFLSSKAAGWLKQHDDEIALIRQKLNEKLPEKIAVIIAEMQNLDCECRKKVEKNIRSIFEQRISNAAEIQERLTALIRTQYMETSEKLTLEFRIFTATNALVFLFLGVAVLIKRDAGLHLLPIAVVLLVAALLVGYLYLFNQNWLHTIVFGDYVGFAFVGYLAVAFAFLCDALFNRARITTRLLNILFNVVGSSLQAVPC